MVRKLIAGLLVFFFVCSPAYASNTSGSMMLFAARDISPSASVDVTLGKYLYDSNSFTWSNVYSINNSPVLENAPETFVRLPSSNKYDSANPFLGMRVRLNDINVSGGESVTFLINRLCLYMYATRSGEQLVSAVMNQATLSPVVAYVEFSWSGTGKRNNSFSTISGTETVPLDFAFLNSSTSYLSNGGSGLQFSDKPVSDLSFSFNAELPSKHITSDNYEYEVVSGTVNDAVLYVAFPFSSENFGVFPDVIFDSSTYYTLRFMSTYAGGQPKYYLRSSGSPTSSTGGLFASLNMTISNLSSSMSKQFTEVKQEIKQGASEVKTEISNQTQTLTDKLTDVKDGIVQGVTELKEATEQGFQDVVQGITDLPDKMQEMLTEFIVPDEDAVADKMTDFQDLAEEKLGIIYQVPEMMFDAVESLVDGVANPQTSMTFPAFSLPWVDGSQLRVWDSQEFDIIPAGLDNLRDLIQSVSSMVFVIMTFNSLKRAYERFFLGGDN